MIRSSFALLGSCVALLGCNQSSPPAAPDVTVVAANPRPEPAPPPKIEAPKKEQPPKKEEPQQAFPFPNDAAGRALPKVVLPPAPAQQAVEKFGKEPAVRAVPRQIADPDPRVKSLYALPALLPEKAAALLPAAPAETIPLDLGFGTGRMPGRPVLPESPGVSRKARDVKLPPELTPLAQPAADRASLDDPTSEAGNAIIVNRTPIPAFGTAGFLKVTLPDPFELAEQEKPKVPAAAEPSAAPVILNPQRIK
jgi:hypothetical protein